MPRKQNRPCAYPLCAKLIDPSSSYCEEHSKRRDKQYSKFSRNKVSKTFYDSTPWKKLRNSKRLASPICEICQVCEAEMVHHIIEISEDYAKRLEYDNLQSVCHACHNRLHGQKND